MRLSKIVEFIDDVLSHALPVDFRDISFNGLQFEGKDEVGRVGLAVDSSIDVIEQAVKEGIDLLIVHHGLFWREMNPSLVGNYKKKIKLLLDNNISVYAAHAPLDAHPVIGNNVLLGKALGLEVKNNISLKSIEFAKLVEAGRKINPELKVIDVGHKTVNHAFIASGAGGWDALSDAVDNKCDVLITGDHTYLESKARDENISVITLGHYATETFGVKALGELVNKKLGVPVKFIDAVRVFK